VCEREKCACVCVCVRGWVFMCACVCVRGAWCAFVTVSKGICVGRISILGWGKSCRNKGRIYIFDKVVQAQLETIPSPELGPML
jgi:hypothetical protein